MNERNPSMKSIILFELTNFRWLGFFLAMLGVYLLSDGDYFGNPMVQAIGWGSACLSALFWVIMGVRDKDIPRTLMELVYMILALRAIINWVG